MHEYIVYFLIRFWTSKTNPVVKTIALPLPELYGMRYDEITTPEMSYLIR